MLSFSILPFLCVLASIFGENLGQSCDKSSYLTEGLACKLDIFLRSEGESDANLTVAKGSSFLIVNGRDYSSKSQGINIAVFHQKTGTFVTAGVFDVKNSSGNSDKLKEFITALPNAVIILMAIQTSGNTSNILDSAKAALTSIGVNDTAIGDQESYTAVLCKGGSNCEVKQAKNAKGNGPTFLSVTIRLPYGYIPNESLRAPYYDVALKSNGGSCSKASSQPADCVKILDGLTSTEWVSSSQGIGAWVQIEFPPAKINKVRIYQRTVSSAQIKDLRLDFSDCTTVHVAMTKNKNNFEDFWFSPRVVSWLKFTTTSTHSATSSVGFKSIQLNFDLYETDSICDHASVSSGGTSSPYPLLSTSLSLRLKSQDAVIILATTKSASGPRYEIVFDEASSNFTHLRRSQDGSTVKTVATSVKRLRYVSSTALTNLWLDWSTKHVAVGMGEVIIIYYPEESPLTPRYWFLKSPTTSAVCEVCGRPDYLFGDANHYWPMDKVIITDLITSKRGTVYGNIESAPVTGNLVGFNAIALKFEGSLTWVDLGDFKDDCLSKPDLCEEGFSVLLRFTRTGSGERYILSTGGEIERGFAISYKDMTGTVTVEVRDGTRRWLVEQTVSQSGQQLFGFSWSQSEGLFVTIGFSEFSVKEDIIGEKMETTSNTNTHLLVGKPSTLNSKYFQGTIDNIAVYYRPLSVRYMQDVLKGNVLKDFASSCYQRSLLDTTMFYHPALEAGTLTTFQCREHCDKAHSKNAVISDGGICLCFNSTDSMTNLADEECDVPCNGNRQLKCGGIANRVTVLGAVQSKNIIVCNIPSMQETFTKIHIQITASKPFFEPEEYRIDSGDGMITTSPRGNFYHRFLNTHNKTITPEVKFKNNETGEYVTIPCPNSVTSYVTTKALNLSCPLCSAVNQDTDCNITFSQSQQDSVILDNDGSATTYPLLGSYVTVIGFPCATRTSSNTASGLYILPFPVNIDGHLMALDVDVIKAGYLEVKCLEVVCDPAGRYCPSQQACVNRTTACQDTDKTCPSNNTLDMSTGYCKTKSCSDMLPAQSTSNIKYKPKFNLIIWANAGYRRLITLNTSVETSSCHFFGVHIPETTPALLSFTKCNSCGLHYSSAIVKIINQSANIYPGHQSPNASNGPTVSSQVPNVKLRIRPKGRAALKLKYSTDGQKAITLTSVKTGLSSRTELSAQFTLSNLTFSSSPAAHPTNKLSNISLLPHGATNVTYQWMFSTTNVTSFVPWILYSCPKAGMNPITLFGSNCMSLSYTVCEILCQDEIDGLQFAPDGLETIAEGDTARINFMLYNGSHVNISIDPGDNTGLRYLTNSKVSKAVLVASLNKTYLNEGLYEVNVTACNLINCKSIVGNISVQSKIVNLTLTTLSCRQTNRTVIFTASISQGSNVQYSWATDGGKRGITSVPQFTYIYTTPGMYNISSIAFNNVSTALVFCQSVDVKDAIGGIEVGPVIDSGIPNKAVIPYMVHEGSDMQVSICYGDGTCEVKNGTFSAEGVAVYNGSFSHNYTQEGDYVANLTFCNCIDCNSTTTNVHVERTVKGPKVSVGRTAPTVHMDPCSSALYVPTDEIVYMVADISDGTNVKATWEFGDGESANDYKEGEFYESGAHANHSYSKAGNYTITVTLENQNGIKEFSCAIIVQNRVLSLEMTSNSPQKFPVGAVRIVTKTNGTRPSDPIQCVLSFSDGESTGHMPMSHEETQTLVTSHNFPHFGYFDVLANCSNAVSNKTKSIVVEIQDEIFDPMISFYGTESPGKSDLVNGEGYEGPSKRGKIFAVEHDILFESKSFNGTNKTCTYCFDCKGAEEVIKNTSCGNITHKFQKAGNKTVTLTVSNDVSSKSISEVISVEDSISCNEVEDSGPQEINTTHILKVSPTKCGPKWCCKFKFGDNSDAELFFLRDNMCDTINEGKRKKIQGLPFIIKHTYPKVGEYKNTLSCYNRVSECTKEVKTVVVFKPCKQPVVSIVGLFNNMSNIPQFEKSRQIVIETSNKVDCQASKKSEFSWKLDLVDENGNTKEQDMLKEAMVESLEDKNLIFKPKSLDYGKYWLSFTLNMTDMIGVESTYSGYFEVIESKLKAEFTGGSERRIGFNKNQSLDARNSKDPDVDWKAEDDKNITCYFFCKSENDSYTLPDMLNATNIPSVPAKQIHNITYRGGCFGDGPGRIESRKCSVLIDTGKMLENTTYTFQVCLLHEDGRSACTQQTWNITTGDPPIMAITCLKCGVKLNPSSKSTFKCYCEDCPQNTQVIYQWSVCYGSPDQSDCTNINENNLKRYYLESESLTGRNLVVSANSLEVGNEYRFICHGWRGKKSGVGGQAVEKKEVNSPPLNGKCNVSPLSGIAGNTTFTIQCDGWLDEDKPLKYAYGSVKDCNDIKNPSIIATETTENKYEGIIALAGDKSKNSTLYINVQVIDKYRAVNNSVCIQVQVKEQKLDFKQIENALDNNVEELLASGNTVAAANTILNVASSLVGQSNDAENSKTVNDDGGAHGSPAPTKSPQQKAEEKKKRIEMMNKVTNALGKVKTSSISDVLQTSQVATKCMEAKPDEVSPAAQEAVGKALESMTVTLLKNANEGAEINQVETAIDTMFTAVSGLIGVVAHSAKSTGVATTQTTVGKTTVGKSNTEAPMTETEREEKSKFAGKMMDMVNDLALCGLRTMITGQKPMGVSTKTMNMTLKRESSSELANKTIGFPGGAAVDVPSVLVKEDKGGGEEPDAVDSKFIASDDNIYSFAVNADLTDGGQVLTIEFYNSTNQNVTKIDDLDNPIEISIPRLNNPIVPVPRQMTTQEIYYHHVKIAENDVALTIEVWPENCNYGFEVYLKRDCYPDKNDNDFNFTLPHNDYWDLESNCSRYSSNDSKAFVIFISAHDFNYTAAGDYKLGIKPIPRNGSGIVEYLPANYTLETYTSMCVFYDNASATFSTKGCEVSPKTTPNTTICSCTHLTSFTSSCIVPPNTLDWDKIANPSWNDMVVILSTVLTVYGIYLICLIFARRADRRDAEKTGVCPLPDNDPRDSYCYEIHVHTGFMRGAGTSAEVSIVMNGSVGDSDPRVLKDPVRKTFRTGGVDAFLMTAPQSLGVLKNIRIWHNNAGGYPSWNLLRIMIQDLQSGKRWWFVCDEWLAVDEGDGKIERILYPATSNDLTKFNVLFATEIRKSLTDGHLWFSVVTRPARSTFTRVQRLTCCLCILLTSMLANMMFYRNDQEGGPEGSIQIAGFAFSLRQVSIGITSSLVVFPANLIIVQLFRKARAKEVKNNIKKYDDITLEDEDVEKATEVDDIDEKPKPPAKKEGLPYWCAYIAYAVAFISCVVATTFVFFYGITFGKDKTAKWLMSMTISLVQDVLISQPVKIFILASMFALLIKDPNKAESDPITDANKLSTDEEWLHKNVKDLTDDEKQDFKKLITDRPPDEAKLEIARQLRMKEKQMKSIIRELVWYMIFLIVVLTISYGNRHPDTYRITKYMDDLFVKSSYNGTKKFKEVHKIEDYWRWVNETVIPSVYKEQWYNNATKYPLGFLADTPTDFLLAVVRMRQLRIKKDSCTYLPAFQHVIYECNDEYSSEEEDRNAYLHGWVPPPNVNTTLRPPKAKKTAWEYQTGSELNTFPYWGYKATYNAGGYAKELPTNGAHNIDKAYSIVAELQSANWIDRYTRAVFTELAIYNANTNFFCVITLLYEQLPTGALFNYPSILTLKLYRYVGGDMYFVMACEITYMFFTLFFIFRELKKVKKEGSEALKNVWSVTEIFITMLSLSLVVLYFLRIKFTDDAVAQMRSDHSQFVSFNYTAFLDEWINAMMGFIVFLSFIKIIRLLRFNRRMSLLAQTLKVCIPRIAAFLIIYGISFFAFSLLGCLVFGQDMQGFGTIPRSATTLMDTILGKFQLREMTNANRIIGPIFFYFYTVTMVFILINMFLSIINDSFNEVNRDVNKQSNEYEIVDFMVHRLKENIGKTMGNAIVPIYKEPKTKLEKDFDAIEENADNIMHHMRNLTFENMRHTRWFDANTSKQKKKKMFEILMEVDWDYFEDELGDSIPVFEDFLSKYDEKRLQSVHESYVYNKLREHESESKMSSVVDSGSDEDSSDSDSSDNDSDAPSNVSGIDEEDIYVDREDVQIEIEHDAASVRAPSPGPSIRSMYGPQAAPRPLSAASNRPPSSLSMRKTPVPSLTVTLPTVSLATEEEMTKVLEDVERERCATDAELNSFLPEIRSINENNEPHYESDPEQVKKKDKKKKKRKADKKKKDQRDPETFSVQSKPAWGDSDTMIRKSPAGSSEKDRLIPDGEESKDTDSQGRDNDAFEGEPLKIKEKKRKKKRRKESDV